MNNEIKSEKKNPILQSLYDFAELFVIAICVVILLFTFGARLCRVNGDSMYDTLHHSEMLLVSDFLYTPKQGDIIVFHQTHETDSRLNEHIVKRVIATEGQTVTVNITTGATYVDGKLISETYAHFNQYGGYNQGDVPYLFDMGRVSQNELGQDIFTATVPEGKVFVMGDNRNNSSDSRNRFVGFVDEDCILGKALFRISPFTKLS